MNAKNNKTSQSNSLKNAILIFPIIAIIGAVWLILVNIGELPENLTFGQDFKTWLNLWILIFVISIVILICIPQSGESTHSQEISASSKSKATVEAPESKMELSESSTMVSADIDEKPVEFTPLTKKETKTAAELSASTSTTAASENPDQISTAGVERVSEKDRGKQKIIEYPSEVEGGLYGDTFIEIDEKKLLKLRTLVVNDIYLL